MQAASGGVGDCPDVRGDMTMVSSYIISSWGEHLQEAEDGMGERVGGWWVGGRGRVREHITDSFFFIFKNINILW